MPVALGLLSLNMGVKSGVSVGCCILPEHGGVGDVVVNELPPLHHIVGVQITRGVHVRHDIDTHLETRKSYWWWETNMFSFTHQSS